MEILFGLENSHNWGWDWFTTKEDALAAMKSRVKLYSTNDFPIEMTREEIEENNL